MALSFEVVDNTAVLYGTMDEHVSKDFFSEAIAGLDPSKGVSIDFGNVENGNSMGLRTFYLFVQTISVPFTYKKVPYWLIEQFNMIRGLLKKGWRVESMLLPFFHQDSDEEITLECTLGKEIPVLKDYSECEIAGVTVNGQEYLPDFDPSCDFMFLEDV